MAFKIKVNRYEGKRKDGKYKQGQLVYEKIIEGEKGKYAIKMYYFKEFGKDAYRIYAWKQTSPNTIIESQATNYPIGSYEEAVKNVNDYKTERDVLILHPALRNK